MIRSITCLVAAFLIFQSGAVVAEAQQNQTAIDAAKDWVNLVDSGQYATSWDEASPLFRNSISRPDWIKSLDTVRTPLGKVLTRKFKNSARVTSLPGAPDGKYLIIEFNTSFQNKDSAIETVTTIDKGNGKWGIAGYFIR